MAGTNYIISIAEIQQDMAICFMTVLFPQYVYGEVEGYLSDIGSTLSQMERAEW